ncbi:P-type calcium ATPase [Pseudozyma hubeiensis SY62]|uniref:P-type calcium ATPase n=1 Tax=Pseudozyma hubeiensis (strain SY62) TaxID=1305764 RepID=R9NZ75_PSEHS|nr:P-type calcium ATPase [Pseudozyma hubeiensis SY62]GAC94059.1 P-type calcium ATPase [Pseudozyma hubeiensis SY62]
MRSVSLFSTILLLIALLSGSSGSDASDDSLEGFTDRSDSSKEGHDEPPRSVEATRSDSATSGRFVDDFFASPDPSELPMPHPVLARLAPPQSGVPTSRRRLPAPLQNVSPGPNAPPSHPGLARKRAREMMKDRGRLRGDQDGSMPSSFLPPREEGQGRRRLLRPPPGFDSPPTLRRIKAGPSVQSFELGSPARRNEAVQSSAFRDASVRSGAEQTREAAAAAVAPDSWLERLFHQFRSSPASSSQIASFHLHGLRYGRIPVVTSRLPPVSQNGDLDDANARALLPQDVRWIFDQTENRRRVSLIALDRSHPPHLRKVMADEAMRYYNTEADQIRRSIEGRNQLVLYTSGEWRSWLQEHAVPLLMSEVYTFGARTQNVLSSNIVEARYRLATRMQMSNMAAQDVIALHGDHEKWAANFLLAWWTSSQNKRLHEGLEHLH